MAIHERGSYIEGIGDEVVYGLSGLFGILIPAIGFFLVWSRRSSENQTIHPDNEEAVQSLRTRLQHQDRHGPDAAANPARHGNRDRRCPICIDDARYAIETNCGHVFCGMCIVTYWQHGRWLGAVACPVCRQRVTILLFNFTEEERRENNEEKAEITQNINNYNRRFSGAPRSVMDHLRDLPTLLRHCLTEVFSFSGLLIMFRVRVLLCFVAALLYFISPLDIIPEAAFGLLGFLDDFFILLLLAIYVSIMYRHFVANRETA